MLTYLRQLFTKSYWRLVTRKQFWRDSWVAVRRVHKDKRSRKQIKLLFQVLITPILWLIILVWVGALIAANLTDQDAFAGLSGISFLLWLLLRFAFRRRRVVYRDSHERSWADERLYRPGVRKEVAELTLVYAVLADRAGSEGFLAVKTIPEQLEVTTRRNHVAMLREHGLWDRLGTEERELLMRPDGGWESGLPDRVAERVLEPLRVLRWVLRIDTYLPSLGQDMSHNFEMAKELAREPSKVLTGYDLIDRKNLEIAKDVAMAYFQRASAEGVKRGYFQPESEGNLAWSQEYSARMADRQGADLLVGAKIMSEAEEQTIRWVAWLAVRRAQTCEWLIQVLSGKRLVEDCLEIWYARKVSEKD